MMQGFFRANGGCGYVKKPDFLLSPDGSCDEVFNSMALPVKKTLKVHEFQYTLFTLSDSTCGIICLLLLVLFYLVEYVQYSILFHV